jgi:hypothetical protein
MKTGRHIKMTFICGQDWNKMSPTPNGKYCEACKKELRDFTKSSIAEIRKEKAKNENICGSFSLAQVDPSLIRPIAIPKQVRALGFIGTLFLMLSSKTSFAQVKLKASTEQVENKSGHLPNPDFVPRDTASAADSLPLLPDPGRKKSEPKKHEYYWSWRFPFIRKVPVWTRTAGRFL